MTFGHFIKCAFFWRHFPISMSHFFFKCQFSKAEDGLKFKNARKQASFKIKFYVLHSYKNRPTTEFFFDIFSHRAFISVTFSNSVFLYSNFLLLNFPFILLTPKRTSCSSRRSMERPWPPKVGNSSKIFWLHFLFLLKTSTSPLDEKIAATAGAHTKVLGAWDRL